MIRNRWPVRLLLGLALVVAAGCVKIETGPQTAEDATDAAGARANQQRVQWAEQFQRAQPEEKVRLWRLFVDSTCANYIQYGFKVAEQWRQGNAGRGSSISAEEMQQTVDRWNKTQQPIIKANEDVLEYGVEQIKLTNAFGPPVLEPITHLRDQYYALYSVVFFPRGTVDEYQQAVQAAKGEIERRSLDLERGMGGR